jgi:hypothetical protein
MVVVGLDRDRARAALERIAPADGGAAAVARAASLRLESSGAAAAVLAALEAA